MSKQTIGIGTTANDGTGDNLRAAFTKANANFDELYRAAEALGLRRRPILAWAGDSIASQFADQTNISSSPISFALMALAHRDFYWDGAVGAIDGSGGYNFGIGGSPSSYLVTNYSTHANALAKLQAKAVKPDIVFVQSMQNDAMSQPKATIDSYVQNYKDFCAGALAAGVGLCVIFPRPPYTGQVGALVPQNHQHANNALAEYADATPGVLFIDYLPQVKAISDANENNGASSVVAWRGSSVTGGYSNDGTHPSAMTARMAAPRLVPLLEKYGRPVTSRVSSFAAWHNTDYPFNNILGRNGLMVGTSGRYNGTNNANVAGSAASNNNRWGVTDTGGHGVTLTPSIITHGDGYARQRLTLGGTAAADGSATLAWDFYSDITSAPFNAEALLDFTNVIGLDRWRLHFMNSAIDFNFNTSQSGTLNESFFLRTLKPVVLSNSGSANKPVTLTLFFKSGATPSGTVDLGRVGIFRES